MEKNVSRGIMSVPSICKHLAYGLPDILNAISHPAYGLPGIRCHMDVFHRLYTLYPFLVYLQRLLYSRPFLLVGKHFTFICSIDARYTVKHFFVNFYVKL